MQPNKIMLIVTVTSTLGETTRRAFALEEGMRCCIGRDESCEISLPLESHLSRVHCILSYENGQLIIQDNQSSNGIFLNGERIVSDFLRLNEAYNLGNVVMVVSESDTAEETPAANGASPGEGDVREKAPMIGETPLREGSFNPTEAMTEMPPSQDPGVLPDRNAVRYPAQQGTPPYRQQAVPQGYTGAQGGYGAQPAAPVYPQAYGNQVAPAPGYMQGYGASSGYPNASVYPQTYSPYPQAGYGAVPQGYPMGYPPPAYPQGGYPVNYPSQQAYPGGQNYPVNPAYRQTYPTPQSQGYPYPVAAPVASYPVPNTSTVAAQPYSSGQSYDVSESVPAPREETLPVAEEGMQSEEKKETEGMSEEEQMAAELEKNDSVSLEKTLMDKVSDSLSSGKEALRRWAAKLLHKSHKGEEDEIWEEEQEGTYPEEESIDETGPAAVSEDGSAAVRGVSEAENETFATEAEESAGEPEAAAAPSSEGLGEEQTEAAESESGEDGKDLQRG